MHTHRDMLFIRPPGAGKTMLAIGLARAAVEQGPAPTSPPPKTSPPAAKKQQPKATGPPQCGPLCETGGSGHHSAASPTGTPTTTAQPAPATPHPTAPETSNAVTNTNSQPANGVPATNGAQRCPHCHHKLAVIVP